MRSLALILLLTASGGAAEVFLGETAKHFVKIEVEGDRVVERWNIPRLPSRPPKEGLAFTNAQGMAMTWAPPGSFRMGEVGAGVRVDVAFEQGFWIGAHEVTQDQYEQLAGRSPSRFSGDRRPVDRVTWEEARSFCDALTKSEKGVGRLPPGWRYRLPTEAEWEYAARAGSTGARFDDEAPSRVACDDPALGRVAWYCGNSETGDPKDHDAARWSLKGQEGFFGTHQVGRRHPNSWGLYDVLGNVEEWCLDSWYPGHGGAFEDGRARGATDVGGARVVRGGSWLSAGFRVRPGGRRRLAQDMRRPDVGFRVVLVPAQERDLSATPPPPRGEPGPPGRGPDGSPPTGSGRRSPGR